MTRLREQPASLVRPKGETLTVSNTPTDQDGMGTVSYHWYRDGGPSAMGVSESGENGVSGMAGSDLPQFLRMVTMFTRVFRWYNQLVRP